MRPGLRQHVAEDLLDLVEVLLRAGQRRRKLDDRVAPVVRAADQAGIEQRMREEAAEQPLRLVVVERRAGGLVLYELDAVEVSIAAHVADDRQVIELFQARAERALVRPD